MITEEWRDIKGFQGFQVSNQGRVKDFTGRDFRDKNGVICKWHISYDGYVCVNLWSTRTNTKSHRVHRLVATAFLDNPHNYPVVNHKNGKKDDNSVENLEWCTQSHNVLHRYHTLYPETVLSPEVVNEIFSLAIKGELSDAEISKRFGVSKSVVYSIKKGRNYKHITSQLCENKPNVVRPIPEKISNLSIKWLKLMGE